MLRPSALELCENLLTATMELLVSKVLAAVVIFVMTAVGSSLAIHLSSTSVLAVQCCNSFAGGVLMVVAIVDMLPDNSSKLDDIGGSISNALDGDKTFPFGNALLVLGFLLIPTVEALMGKGAHNHNATSQGAHDHGQRGQSPHDHGNTFNDSIDAGLANSVQPNQSALLKASSLADVALRPSHNLTLRTDNGQGYRSMVTSTVSISEHLLQAQEASALTVSAATLLMGLSLHAVIEGLATGAAEDVRSVLYILIAVSCHKGFAAFALGSALLPLWTAGQKRIWVLLSFLFAFAGVLGIALGACLSVVMTGAGVAILSCVAAGTLLNIGICEMLVPALADPAWRRRKVMIAVISSVCMGLLLAWA